MKKGNIALLTIFMILILLLLIQPWSQKSIQTKDDKPSLEEKGNTSQGSREKQDKKEIKVEGQERPLEKRSELLDKKYLIAHAGGSVYGLSYTNSLEAIEKAYKNGFRYIELDFQLTSDGHIVLIHDWDNMVELLFDMEARQLSHQEFKTLDTILDLSLLDIEDLILWLKDHKDVKIVMDTKSDMFKVLDYIGEKHPDEKDSFIVQIYNPKEYSQVKNLGYDKIIYSLSRTKNSDDKIMDFVEKADLYAVAIPSRRAYTGLARRVKKAGVKAYAYTVNDYWTYKKLVDYHIQGLYTDNFEINNFKKID